MPNQSLMVQQEQTLKAPETQEQFAVLLGDRSQHFIASILGVLAGNDKLANCTPASIVLAGMKGAALDLSFDASLGEAYMLPFKGKAVFVPGYKGLTQLCLRTGQFSALGVKAVTSRMLRDIQGLRSSAEIIDYLERCDFFPELLEGKIEGFCAYFRLTNGYTKYLYWSKKQCLEHAEKYSPTWNKQRKEFTDFSAWRSHEDAMCSKSVYRQLLLKDAPKSKELHSALESETEAGRVYANQKDLPVLSDGNEDKDIYGEDPEPSELTQARANVKKLWESWGIHPAERNASFKKFCREHDRPETTVDQCSDAPFLKEYGKYKQGKLKAEKAEKAAAAEPTPEEHGPQEAYDYVKAIYGDGHAITKKMKQAIVDEDEEAFEDCLEAAREQEALNQK